MEEKTKQLLQSPISSEAISQHPTKNYLSTIKPVYVSERLNNAFGLGAWSMDCEVLQSIAEKKSNGKDWFTVVVKGCMTVEGKSYYHFGGSSNDDYGDAYKGAMTDAMTKIAVTYFDVAINVYKGKSSGSSAGSSKQDDGKPWFNKEQLEIVRKGLAANKDIENIKAYVATFKVAKTMREELKTLNKNLI